VGSNPISSTKMTPFMRSFSVLPVVGLPLRKPFANYLPTLRASQYKRNRAFFPSPRGVREGSWARGPRTPTTSTDSEADYNPTTSKQVGMTHRETALVQIARFSSK